MTAAEQIANAAASLEAEAAGLEVEANTLGELPKAAIQDRARRVAGIARDLQRLADSAETIVSPERAAVMAMEAAQDRLREIDEILDYTIESFPDGWEVLPCHFTRRAELMSKADAAIRTRNHQGQRYTTEASWTYEINENTWPKAPFPEAVDRVLRAAVEEGAIQGEDDLPGLDAAPDRRRGPDR